MNIKAKQHFPHRVRTTLKTIILLIFIVSISGCSSGFKNISPRPPSNPNDYEKLGQVEGKACGSLISPLAGTAYYFIPALLNSRVERAYEDALNQKPGATSLINVTMDESWFWWILGTARCVTIQGEAIK